MSSYSRIGNSHNCGNGPDDPAPSPAAATLLYERPEKRRAGAHGCALSVSPGVR